MFADNRTDLNGYDYIGNDYVLEEQEQEEEQLFDKIADTWEWHKS